MSEHDPADAKPDDKEGFAADAKNVAVDTLKGAKTAGLAGAAVGATKGLLKSRRGRQVLAAIVVALLLVGAMQLFLMMSLVGGARSGLEAQQQGVSAQQVLDAGVEPADLEVIMDSAKERGVPWHMLAAVYAVQHASGAQKGTYGFAQTAFDDGLSETDSEDLEASSDWVAAAMRNALEDQDGYNAKADIGTGGDLDPDGNLTFPDQEVSDTLIRETYGAAIASLPLTGASETWAGQIVELAIRWRFGLAGTIPGSCPTTGSPPLPDNLSFTITAEQMANATTIVNTGKSLAIPEQGQVIALMAALAESTLVNLDYGDRDSLGLFQQRPSTGWGTPEQIMDPVLSSKAFYGLADHTTNPGLVDISGWESMSPGEAAQAVQRSAVPDGYDRWEPDARLLVATINGTAPPPGTTKHYDIGPVKPATQYLADFLGSMFDIETIYGWRESDPYPDHPSGSAADFMVFSDRAKGDALAQYAMEHAAELKIKYILWYQRSWNAGDPVGQWEPMEDRGGDTANHKDHVHITITDESTPVPDPVVDVGPVQPLAQHAADVIGPMFDVTEYVGYVASDYFVEHPGGVAIDFVVGTDSAKGDQIAQYAMEHAAELHIAYVVWKGRYWHLDDTVGQWKALTGGIDAHTHDQSVHITSTENTVATSCGPSTPTTGDWVNPLPAGQYALTSPFGWRIHPITGIRTFHAGQDMGTGASTPPIVAAAAGTVLVAGDCGCGYGNLTTIDVGGGLVMYYGHQSAISVTAGQVVKAGDPIGTVGTTGASTGNHLHFEFRQDGEPVDPIPILASHGVTL